MLKTVSFSLALSLCFSLHAQQSQSNFEIKQRHSNGTPSFIIIKAGAAGQPQNETVSQWFKKNLAANDNFVLKQLSNKKDGLGNSHYRYQQFYNNIPVDGSMVNVHYKGKDVTSLNGSFYPALNVNTQAALTENAALEIALARYGNAVFAWQDPAQEAFLKKIKEDPQATYAPKGELVIASRDNSLKTEDFRLAYKFNIYVSEPLAREFVYIDAIDGSILYTEELLHSADRPGTAHTRFGGVRTIMCDSIAPDSFALRESGRGQGIETYNALQTSGKDTALMFYDDDNVWNNANASQDEVATDVHWGMEMTFDYYQDVLKRFSIDDMGKKMVGMVHVQKKYNNAFWNGDYASFGDGDSSTFYPLVSLDVCGHEISHGMTQFSAGLKYRFESGALNESFSDIFGKAIEHHTTPSTFTWKIGANIRPGGAPLRDMQNPNTQSQPKYYKDAFYYRGTDVNYDNGGVHINSGVQNYWFYLLCEGGSGKRWGDQKPFTVNAIGIEKATKLAYETLMFYLEPNSQYTDAAAGSIVAAESMFGSGTEDLRQVKMAWYAVGLADFPGYGVGITDIMSKDNVRLFPNPAANTVTVSLDVLSEPVEATVTDITGQSVLSTTLSTNDTELDIASFQKGVYFLSLKNGITLKFIKI